MEKIFTTIPMDEVKQLLDKYPNKVSVDFASIPDTDNYLLTIKDSSQASFVFNCIKKHEDKIDIIYDPIKV